jgi:hypothetical protein
MSKTEALTVLVRRHQKEFNEAVSSLTATTGAPRSLAKKEAVKLLANKYQTEYVHLRGKDLKGRL